MRESEGVVEAVSCEKQISMCAVKRWEVIRRKEEGKWARDSL